MAATYDQALGTDRDWVRFLIGDTDVSSPSLSDEEISAVLVEEAATGSSGVRLKYFAAASCLAMLSARWASMGRGVSSKSVGRLSISWGTSGSAQSLADRIGWLRQRGIELELSSPAVFKNV